MQSAKIFQLLAIIVQETNFNVCDQGSLLYPAIFKYVKRVFFTIEFEGEYAQSRQSDIQ
jgi:hypothetical protein